MNLDAKQRKMCEGRRRSAYKLRALTKRILRCGRSAPGEPQTLAGPIFWARGLWLLALLAGTLSSLASAPLHDPLRPQFAASVEIVTVHAGTGEEIPVLLQAARAIVAHATTPLPPPPRAPTKLSR